MKEYENQMIGRYFIILILIIEIPLSWTDLTAVFASGMWDLTGSCIHVIYSPLDEAIIGSIAVPEMFLTVSKW